MIIAEVYDAFLAAGAPEDKARSAAQAITSETLATKSDITRIEKELLVVKWMLGIVIVAVVIPVVQDIFL